MALVSDENEIFLNKSFKLSYKFDKTDEVFVSKSAFNGNFRNILFPNLNSELIDYQVFFNLVKPKIHKILYEELARLKSIKTNFFLRGIYTNALDYNADLGFKTQNYIFTESTDFDEYFESSMKKLIFEQDVAASTSSGFSLKRIISIELRTNKHSLLKMKCSVVLPKFIANKKAVISPKNKHDNMCFLYCILAKYNAPTNKSAICPRNIKLYKKLYKWNQVNFPTSLLDVKHWEKINNHVSVNIFSYDSSNNFYAIKLCESEKTEHFNLLIVNDSINYHFCLITDLSRLFSRKISNSQIKVLFCLKCMLHFYNPKHLMIHKKFCEINRYTSIRLPPKNTYVEFKNKQSFYPCDFVAVSDIECLCVEISGAPPSNSTSYTHFESHHQPYAFGFMIHSQFTSEQVGFKLGYSSAFCETGVLQKYFALLDEVTKNMEIFYDRVFPMDDNARSREMFKKATHCAICSSLFSKLNPKYRHHNHNIERDNITLILCNTCNLALHSPRLLTIYYINGRNYDFIFLISELAKYGVENVDVIPDSMEKFTSIMFKMNSINIRFADLLRYIPLSLRALNNVLPKDKFIYTKQYFPHDTSLFTRKSVLFYDWLNSYEKLSAKALPERNLCSSKLTGELPTIEDYDYAQKLWKKMNCQTVFDYCDIYLKIDVLTSIDNVLYFRELILSSFKLDMCYYFSLAGVGWDSFLLNCDVKLENISEPSHYDWCQRSRRGGIVTVVKKVSFASNTRNIKYWDSNSLYGGVMQLSAFPVGDYEFINPLNFDLINTPHDGEFGFFVEIDVIFPRECQDYLNDLPPLPERKKSKSGVSKLILDFCKKEYYICFLANAQLAVKLGAKVTCLHRVFKYRQARYIQKFGDKCLYLRKNSTDEASSMLFKLFYNSVFGKFSERPESRINVKIITNEKAMINSVRQPRFQDRILVHENLAVTKFHKASVLINRLPLVGCQILEISKIIFYSFFYFVLKTHFHDRVKLILSDTDSHIVQIDSINIVEELKQISHHFDFSNLDKNDPLYSDVNKKVACIFKSEVGSRKINAICAARPKLYSLLLEDNSVFNRAKGVNKAARDKIKFQTYLDCVLNNTIHRTQYRQLISKSFNMYTAKISKIAINPTCDKRHFLDPYNSLSYGHYLLQVDFPK